MIKPSPRLPPELFEIIISFADRDTLQNLSLVCRDLVPTCRLYLFADPPPLTISPDTFESVLSLVDTPCATLPPYLRALVLQNWTCSANPSKFYATLPRITGRMSSVEALRFEGTDWEEMEPLGALRFLIHNFQFSIKSLELWGCHCESFTSVSSILSAFPLLERISIDKIVRQDRSYAPVKSMSLGSSAPLSHLRAIHINGFIKKELFRWLLRFKPLPKVETIDLGAVHLLEAPSVSRFVKALGADLFHLTISGESTPNLHLHINFKYNPSISSIHITTLVLDRQAQPASIRWFIPLFRSIRSLSMTRLTFTLHTSSVESLCVLDWYHLQICLQQFEFSNLQCVRFIMVHDHNSWKVGYLAEAESYIRDRMSDCDERGILRFATSKFTVNLQGENR